MCSPGEAAAGPSGRLKAKVEDAFGSVDRMKQVFTETAAARFGSGWAWLGVKRDGSIGITSTKDQDNPLMVNADEPMIPILGLDVRALARGVVNGLVMFEALSWRLT